MSSNHRIKLLDLRRREPPKGYLLCRANGGKHMCNHSIEYECSFMVEGPGRRHVRHLFMCPMHAYAFAQRHGLKLPIMHDRARRYLEALEENMKYKIRYTTGQEELGLTLKTVLREAMIRFAMGFAKAKDEALFPIDDLEIDDIVAGPVQLYEDWPDDTRRAPDAYIEKEDDLEVTHANGIAGRKITVEETDDEDGLGACQGHGGGRHG